LDVPTTGRSAGWPALTVDQQAPCPTSRTRDTTVNVGHLSSGRWNRNSSTPPQHRQPGIAGMPFVYDDKDQLCGVDQVLLDRFAPGTEACGPRAVCRQDLIDAKSPAQVFADHRAGLYDTASSSTL
jgi:hypothetical protein